MKFIKSVLVLCVLGLLVLVSLAFSSRGDWRSASRASAGIAPDPGTTHEAVLQVYGADAWGWRGWFAIHTWIGAKRKGEKFYTVYDAVGWRGRYGSGVVGIHRDTPDRYWYGSRPEVLKEHRGESAESLIDAVDAAAHLYPWKNTYQVFPGPNSNTFIAWIAQQVPELELDLPFSAIGAGYVDQAAAAGAPGDS